MFTKAPTFPIEATRRSGKLRCRTLCLAALLWVAVTLAGYAGPASDASAATTSEPPSLEGEAAVLVALYNATTGWYWSDSTNWLTDAPIGEWYGVTTNEEGDVVELKLGSNRLDGTIPPELGSLANLERLILEGNELSGAIPPELGNLSNLTTLSLAWNYDLSGTIPPELGNLANLANLTERNSSDLGGSEQLTAGGERI